MAKRTERTTHLFYRRHYETIARPLGVAYHHARSRMAEQTIDLVVAAFVKVFQEDSPDFNEHRWKASILDFAQRDAEGREEDQP